MNPSAQIVESEYEDFKSEVLRTVAAKLAGAGLELPQLDLEAHYNAAWQVLFLKLRSGEEVENRRGFLVTVAHRLALGEQRGIRKEHPLDGHSLDRVSVEPDHDSQIHSARQLSDLKEALRLKLSERELQAAVLCYFQGYSRAEAAEIIGVSRRRMEKIMDRVSRKVQALAGTIRADRWCDEVDSLIRAFAAGILPSDGERYALARQHLDSCPACRRKVLLLRGLLSLGPPLPLAAMIASSLVGGAAGAAGGTSGGGSTAGGGAAGGSSLGPAIGAALAGLALAAAIVAGVLAFGRESDPAPQARSAADQISGAKPEPEGSAGAASSSDEEARPSKRRRAPKSPHPARKIAQPDSVEATENITPKEEPGPAQAPPSDPPASSEPTPAPSEPAAEAATESGRKQPPLRDAAVEFELR